MFLPIIENSIPDGQTIIASTANFGKSKIQSAVVRRTEYPTDLRSRPALYGLRLQRCVPPICPRAATSRQIPGGAWVAPWDDPAVHLGASGSNLTVVVP